MYVCMDGCALSHIHTHKWCNWDRQTLRHIRNTSLIPQNIGSELKLNNTSCCLYLQRWSYSSVCLWFRTCGWALRLVTREILGNFTIFWKNGLSYYCRDSENNKQQIDLSEDMSVLNTILCLLDGYCKNNVVMGEYGFGIYFNQNKSCG